MAGADDNCVIGIFNHGLILSLWAGRANGIDAEISRCRLRVLLYVVEWDFEIGCLQPNNPRIPNKANSGLK